MDVPAVIFREYDIRGIVGDELTPTVAHAIGRAVTTVGRAKLNRDPRVAVGYDNRPSGDILSRAVRDGVAAAGGTAVDVGVLPTPALYLAVEELDVDGGVQVTGSHNPPEFNGFKMLIAGETLYGDAIQHLRELIESDALDSGPGTIEGDESVLRRYADAIVSRNGPISQPVRIVVDCGNGVASLCAESILSRIGAEVVPLFCDSDGTFPNHHPDPTVAENLNDLQEAVRRTGAQFGIAFDGDGDRIGAVDENGKVVYGDHLLILFGRDLVDRGYAGSPLIFDVKCSEVLAEKLEEAQLEPVIWKTGHSLIKAKMAELNAPMAGEMSGHMFFADRYYGFDDALYATCRLMEIVAKSGKPLSAQLEGLPRMETTPELRMDCPDEIKFAVVAKVAEEFNKTHKTITVDGVRVLFEHGWGLVRSSNTQPVLVLRFEAETGEQIAEYRALVEAAVARAGKEVAG